MSAVAEMQWKLTEMNQHMANVQKAMGRNAGAYVRTVSRRFVKKAAWLCPVKTGRARAGFWPPAIALGIVTVYSPYQNDGEGVGINRTEHTNQTPFVVIGNNVPYIQNAGGHGFGWWVAAINEQVARMSTDLEKYVQPALEGRTQT